MSDTVGEIITRAVSDEAFRHLLLSNPQEALGGYAPTDEDRDVLRDLNEDNLDDFAGGLGNSTTAGTWVPGT